MAESTVFELIAGVQSYDWGKIGNESKVAQFAQGLPEFTYDGKKPYAELWMGTHPSCPSLLLSSRESLKDYLSTRPELLGKKVIARFGGNDLPFLFKVLAIGKALSIQAHPDKELAKRLHDEKPDIYKDNNHKPEMAVALTSFSGFCGFRPPQQIVDYIQAVPEFAQILGSSVSKSFVDRFDGKQVGKDEVKAGLKEMFTALMKADPAEVKSAVATLVARLSKDPEVDAINREEVELIRTLNNDFEGDIGIFCTFVLNIVHLKPGEAVFLKANEPHAYLDGDIMECMATSDNVVRAGLTPKLRDVPTLTSMLTYTASPPSDQVLPPISFRSTKHTTLYNPPIEEFSVLLTDLKAGEEERFEAIDGPSIIIFTKLEGSGLITVNGQNEIQVDRVGMVFFVGSGTELVLNSKDGGMICYRAFVEVDDE